jgi:hypothetical protein
VDPCPQAVLAHTRRHGPAAGADGIRVLALLLADLYDSAPVPAGWSYYRAAVVDEALRRRCAEMATRVGQCAEHDSMDTLLELLGTEMTAVRALHQRRLGLSPTPQRANLQAVRDD